MKITGRVSTGVITSDGLLANAFAAKYSATQIKTRINGVQKQIGAKRKAKENADAEMTEKTDLEKELKAANDSADEKEVTLRKKIGTIGNIVHDSVPINNDEVNCPAQIFAGAL